ncbi:unnamed protein product [Ilex paraguariensis]|uniref:Heme O synthase n=1 Tax=Ilex paraguariensis TaxID=185542 RepID=A0ABC8R4X1_9AQUA
MWRNSLSFSSRFISSANPNPNSRTALVFLRISARYGLERSNSTSASSPSFATDPLELGFQQSDSVRAFGSASSATAIDPTSSWPALSVLKARDLVDLTKHYGRCYWELSKARLSMLVVATSGTGYVLGSGDAIDYLGLCCTCAGTMMVAASANSLNQGEDMQVCDLRLWI